MGFLSQDELDRLLPAETHAFPGPIPTQVVSSDEYCPMPQTRQQAEVEARLKAMGDELGGKQGMGRRAFFRTAAGMAAAFVAMNEVYGDLFDVSRAEAQTPEMAKERAEALSKQFVMDMHTHFLRDDTRIMTFVRQREAVGKAGWNPALAGKPQTIEELKFANYYKEIYLDSDTKVALISGSPSDIPQDWFLTNEMKFAARAKVNKEAGSRRMMSHAIFTPGQPGWLEAVDRAIAELKPDSFKGYTIGDNTNKGVGKYPWRMDDEKMLYPFYEKCVRDVGKAAKDWPKLNFVIYHSAYRFPGGGTPADAWAQFEQTGRIEWVSDLAEIPAKFGVTNVYGDLGQIFAQSTVAHPRVCAAMMGMLTKGLGPDHVVWGTDAIWTGSPQWQIEALRRLEIPEDLQQKHGFKPLGPADGPVKRMILGETNAKLYKYTPEWRASLATDRIAATKEEYERNGTNRSNLRYGFIARG